MALSLVLGLRWASIAHFCLDALPEFPPIQIDLCPSGPGAEWTYWMHSAQPALRSSEQLCTSLRVHETNVMTTCIAVRLDLGLVKNVWSMKTTNHRTFMVGGGGEGPEVLEWAANGLNCSFRIDWADSGINTAEV